jgi:DNA polymerase V
MPKEKIYLAIDLKSFYASVECVERGLDPLTTHLVVADASRTEKTICLAVSPSLKAYGIPGRARLFEVVEQVKEVNARRRWKAPGGKFTGSSTDAPTLQEHPELAVDYLVAPPRMAYYMEYSTRIYEIYLRYVAPEDIQVYSIDEVFMDVTGYLDTYHLTPRQLAQQIVREVVATTGITATAGIGTNLFLCKVAMDIVAKHVEADENGVRIAQLDEESYRRTLWSHRPLTDFWRVGSGTAKKLEERGIYTMGDIARCSLGGPGDYYNEELLYRLFGVNAELLIDHAWGWEPCTIPEIKAYRPATNSLSSGQVLQCPYDFQKGKLIVREMTELLVLELVDKGVVTDQMVLTIGYDRESLNGGHYQGEVTTDRYGRTIPKHAHGTANLEEYTSSTRQIVDAVLALYDRIVDPTLLVRRVTVAANRILPLREAPKSQGEQLDLFSDCAQQAQKMEENAQALEREKRLQQAQLSIRKKFGKNAILKGMNLEEGATTIQRNGQIGGHKA